VPFLRTGASGAGKSSVRQAIEADLAPTVECVELRHLGPVPAVPDVAWRQRMAECAVARAVRLDAERRDLLELLWRHAAFAEWMRRHAEDPAHMPEVLVNDGWQETDWSRLSRLSWNVTVIDGVQAERHRSRRTGVELDRCGQGRVGAGVPPVRRMNYWAVVIGAGMSGCTLCGGAHPGGPNV
jgi:hypothetical protein